MGVRKSLQQPESTRPEAYNPEASIPLICLEPCWGFLVDAAVQSEVRKIILLKYGIREFKAKILSLQRLLYMYVYDRKKLFRGKKDKVIMLNYSDIKCNPGKTWRATKL